MKAKATPETPIDFQSLKTLILARGRTMPKRLQQLASFVIEYPDEIAFGTVASIAKRAAVQPSTLIRFAQSLGYSGFLDLQTIFREPLRERVLNYDERMAHLRAHAVTTSKANVIFQGFTDAAEVSLQNLRQKLDPAKLDQAISLLAKAETIYLIGLRRSFPISSYMSYAFGKLNVRNVLVDAVGGLAPEQIDFAGPSDVVLAISFAPYASETAALVKRAIGQKVPVIAITDSGFSPVAEGAEVWLDVVEANYEGFRSMVATLSLAMTMTVAVAEKRELKLAAKPLSSKE